MTLEQQLADFTQFAEERLRERPLDASLHDLFDEWESACSSQDDRQAILDSLHDLESGRTGRPLREFLADFADSHLRTDLS